MKNEQLDHTTHKASAYKYPICVLAHNIDVTRNIGGLFRMADALGVEAIYLTGSSFTPDNPKVKKSSRSTIKYVPYEYQADPLPLLERLKAEGYTLISLEISTASGELGALSLSATDKVCLILGSENEGVSQPLLDASDITVHIPMLGVNSSMNVVTASAIACYAIAKQLERVEHD